MERVRPDFSTPLNTSSGETYSLDHRFDFVRNYPWLNHAIINIITETGVNRLHTTSEQGLLVAKTSLIACTDIDWIGESEYERYLEIQQDKLDDSWLNK